MSRRIKNFSLFLICTLIFVNIHLITSSTAAYPSTVTSTTSYLNYLPLVTKTSVESALAKQLLSAANEQEAAIAVTNILALAGIETWLESGEIRPGVAPTLPFHVRSIQTYALANDAIARAHGGWLLTLDELGNALLEMGWKFPSDRSPGVILANVLGQAIRMAENNSGSPHSFVPLFLNEIALATNPDVNLASGSADPSTIRLSMLEAELLLLAHLRGQASYESVGQTTTATLFSQAQDVIITSNTPCNDIEESTGKADPLRFIKSIQLVAIDKVVGRPFEKFYESLGITSESGKFAMANALNVLNLVAVTGAVQFTLEPNVTTQHASHLEQYPPDPSDDILRLGRGWNKVSPTLG